MNAPTITAAHVHYDVPTVTVAEYRTTDRLTGHPVAVDTFVRNGGLIEATGFRVRRNGALYTRRQLVAVTVPANVAAALAAL